MARNLSDPITPPVGLCAVERPRVSRELSYLTAADRQPIPVLAEGEEVDWSLLDQPAIERRKDQLDADVVTIRDMLCLKAGSVIDLDLATERARQIVQVLHAMGRLS
jgi:hypothetical protein